MEKTQELKEQIKELCEDYEIDLEKKE